MINIYGAVKIGEGKAKEGKVCDDRILLDRNIMEDGYHETCLNDDDFIVAISDGVGGCGCGYLAAEVALDALDEMQDDIMQGMDDPDNYFAMLNDRVYEIAGDGEFKGTAATFSGLVVRHGKVHILHVGDSRVYQRRNIQGHVFWRQLTEDQNNLHEWRKMPRFREEDAENLKKITGWDYITSYVGMPEQNFAEKMCVIKDIWPEGTFVLTTDGIHDYIDSPDLNDMFSADGTWKEKIGNIMRVARENGSTDDQSIIVVEYLK